MKKKFVLTSALVLIVVASLAAATALEVSGTFKTGYKFEFANPTKTTFSDSTFATVNSAFTGDFWKVTLTAPYKAGKDTGATAKADIYLSSALAAEGVDMGDLAVTLHAGTGVGAGAPSVFGDAGDFATDVKSSIGELAGLTIAYAKLVDVYVAAFPGKPFGVVAGATVKPVDGVAVAVGYANKATNQLGVSASADIAKLVDLEDLDLAVSAGYVIADLKNITHEVNADAAIGFMGIGLDVAYQYGAAHKLFAGLGYSIKDVAGFDLSVGAKLKVTDLSDFKNKNEINLSAGASYGLGGATYALDAAFKVGGAFSLTPSVAISF